MSLLRTSHVRPPEQYSVLNTSYSVLKLYKNYHQNIDFGETSGHCYLTYIFPIS